MELLLKGIAGLRGLTWEYAVKAETEVFYGYCPEIWEIFYALGSFHFFFIIVWSESYVDLLDDRVVNDVKPSPRKHLSNLDILDNKCMPD